MIYARMTGTGSYLPERIVTNAELAQQVNTNDQWIVERTGIRTRHLAAAWQGACDLAEPAARRALEMANCRASDLDLIIVATTTPDRIYPSTACSLQARLGNHGATAFDIQAVCSGFVYAVSIADKFIQTGAARKALVIGTEVYSRIIDWTDRNTCILFGDGAGAVVLEANPDTGILSTHLRADGHYQEILYTPGAIVQGQLQNGDGFTKMHGSEVFKFAVKALSDMIDEVLATNYLEKRAIDWLVPHQANMRIIAAIAKKLKLPLSKVVTTVADHANTAAASVPLALDTAVRDGRIRRGNTLLLMAVGGGFTWGAVLAQF